MAKSLGIRVSGGIANPESVDKAVLSPVTPSGNLGSIVASILSAAADAMIVTVDLGARVVHSRPAAGANKAGVNSGAGRSSAGVFTQVEDVRSSEWIFTNADGAHLGGAGDMDGNLTDIIKVANPTMSVSGLLAKIEDNPFTAGVLGAADTVLVIVDQAASTVEVVDVATAQLATVRALFDAGGAMADEARYEQIPAAEAQGAAVLAFE